MLPRPEAGSDAARQVPRKDRPHREQLGLNRLALALFASTALLALISAGAFWSLGLTLRLGDSLLVRGAQAGIALVVWVYYFAVPGRPREWISAEASAAFLSLLLIAAVLTPSQYPAAALARPTVDAYLAEADAMMGVHVPSLVAWARSKPELPALLLSAYDSLMLQLTLIVPILWLRNDRRSLWEFTFNFHLTATITTLASAVWPVACAFQYYGFESLVSQTRFVTHFTGMRAGTMTVVDMSNLEGMVSMPSFHVAGGLIVTWALRRTWWLCVPVATLNAGLIASTVLTGAHYVIDVVAAAALVVLSVVFYRRVVEPWWMRSAR